VGLRLGEMVEGLIVGFFEGAADGMQVEGMTDGAPVGLIDGDEEVGF